MIFDTASRIVRERLHDLRSIRDTKASSLLVLFLCTDLLFVVLHILHVATPGFSDRGFNLEIDRGFAEIYQYVKGYWAAIACFWLCLANLNRWFAVWAFVFALFTIDDAFFLHERLGDDVARALNLPEALGLSAHDLGEVVIFAVAGIILLIPLGIGYYRGDRAFRFHSEALVLLVAGYAFFGIVVDLVHAAATHSLVKHVLGIVEEGGELVMLSLICWYVLHLLLNLRSTTAGSVDHQHD